MESPDEKRVRLLEMIDNAFRGVPFPGDAAVLAQDCCDEEEIKGLLGKPWNDDWQNVPGEVIEYHYDSLPFLSPEAYVFFFPAFARHVLRRGAPDHWLWDYLVYSLAPQMAFMERMLWQTGCFSLQQNAAAAAFLRHMQDVFGRDPTGEIAREAIELYWKRYLPGTV